MNRAVRLAGLPAFVAFSLALHVWSLLIAWVQVGLGGAVVPFATPVASWCYWALELSRQAGSFTSTYTLCVGLWFGCLALFYLVRWMGKR